MATVVRKKPERSEPRAEVGGDVPTPLTRAEIELMVKSVAQTKEVLDAENAPPMVRQVQEERLKRPKAALSKLEIESARRQAMMVVPENEHELEVVMKGAPTVKESESEVEPRAVGVDVTLEAEPLDESTKDELDDEGKLMYRGERMYPAERKFIEWYDGLESAVHKRLALMVFETPDDPHVQKWLMSQWSSGGANKLVFERRFTLPRPDAEPQQEGDATESEDSVSEVVPRRAPAAAAETAPTTEINYLTLLTMDKGERVKNLLTKLESPGDVRSDDETEIPPPPPPTIVKRRGPGPGPGDRSRWKRDSDRPPKDNAEDSALHSKIEKDELDLMHTGEAWKTCVAPGCNLLVNIKTSCIIKCPRHYAHVTTSCIKSLESFGMEYCPGCVKDSAQHLSDPVGKVDFGDSLAARKSSLAAKARAYERMLLGDGTGEAGVETTNKWAVVWNNREKQWFRFRRAVNEPDHAHTDQERYRRGGHGGGYHDNDADDADSADESVTPAMRATPEQKIELVLTRTDADMCRKFQVGYRTLLLSKESFIFFVSPAFTSYDNDGVMTCGPPYTLQDMHSFGVHSVDQLVQLGLTAQDLANPSNSDVLNLSSLHSLFGLTFGELFLKLCQQRYDVLGTLPYTATQYRRMGVTMDALIQKHGFTKEDFLSLRISLRDWVQHLGLTLEHLVTLGVDDLYRAKTLGWYETMFYDAFGCLSLAQGGVGASPALLQPAKRSGRTKKAPAPTKRGRGRGRVVRQPKRRPKVPMAWSAKRATRRRGPKPGGVTAAAKRPAPRTTPRVVARDAPDNPFAFDSAWQHASLYTYDDTVSEDDGGDDGTNTELFNEFSGIGAMGFGGGGGVTSLDEELGDADDSGERSEAATRSEGGRVRVRRPVRQPRKLRIAPKRFAPKRQPKRVATVSKPTRTKPKKKKKRPALASFM